MRTLVLYYMYAYMCSADVSITQNYLISAGSDSGSLGCFYFDDSPPLVPRAEKLFPHLCEFVTELLSRRKNSGERSVTKAGGCVRATLLYFSTCKSFVVKVMCARRERGLSVLPISMAILAHEIPARQQKQRG